MLFAEVIQPTETVIQASHVVVLSCCRDSLLHCNNRFREAAEVCLEDGQVEESILVKCAVSVMHGVIKVSMQAVEGRRIVPSLPCVKKASQT